MKVRKVLLLTVCLISKLLASETGLPESTLSESPAASNSIDLLNTSNEMVRENASDNALLITSLPAAVLSQELDESTISTNSLQIANPIALPTGQVQSCAVMGKEKKFSGFQCGFVNGQFFFDITTLDR